MMKILDARLLIVLVLGLLAFLFVPDSAFDSFRYYQDADTYFASFEVFDLIVYSYEQNFDFIYYVLLNICKKIQLPYQTVTGISVAVFYYNTFRIIDIYKEQNNSRTSSLNEILSLNFALTSVSYIVIFAISRNLTALVFLFIAFKHFLNGKFIRALIFTLLSVFTHVGMMVILILLLITYFIPTKFFKWQGARKFVIVLLSIAGIFSSLWISGLFNVITLIPFFGAYQEYTKYMTLLLANVFDAGLSLWDKLMFFTTAMVTFFALYHIRDYNRVLSFCWVVFVWLMISIGFSVMFTQRTLMLMVPITAIVSIAFFSQENKQIVKWSFNGLLAISFLTFIINIYAYRDMWIFELP